MPNRHLLTSLLRPLRSYVALITERADAEAVADGLTVEVLPGGVRRYRGPRLDQLAIRRTRRGPQPSSRPALVAAAARRSVGVGAVTRQHVQPPAPVCLDCVAVLHVDEVTGALVDQWGQALCGASYRAHSPDVPVLPAEPAAPANRIPDRRTERSGPHRPGGAGAVPAPTVPRQGRSALAGYASLRDRLRRPLTRDTQQRR